MISLTMETRTAKQNEQASFHKQKVQKREYFHSVRDT